MLMAVSDAMLMTNTGADAPSRQVRKRQRSERPGSRTILNQLYVLEKTCEVTKRPMYYRPPAVIHGLKQPQWTPFIDQGQRYRGGEFLDRTMDNNAALGLRARMVDF